MVSLSNADKISIIESVDSLTVDTEGVAPMLGLSFCVKGMPNGLYLPFHHSLPGEVNLTGVEQKHVLELLSKRRLRFHNAAHDVGVLQDEGIVDTYKFDDTMLMQYWLNEEIVNYGIDWLSKASGGKPKNKSVAFQAIVEEQGWHAVPLWMMDEYSSNDAFIQEEFYWKIKDKFDAEFSEELWQYEQDFIRYVIIPMKRRGILLDMNFITKEFMRGDVIMNRIREKLHFNPTSTLDLKRILIDEIGLPVVSHTKACKKCYPDRENGRWKQPEHPSTHWGKPSFDKKAMEEYDLLLEAKDDDRAKDILTYRGWQKTNSSNYKAYMRLADKDRVLHPSYKLHGTRTRRLSCEDPNLQQIPKSTEKDWNGGLKKAFIPREGFELWTVDYSQLQFRMTVGYANITKLIDIFNDETRDIFDEMATDMGWVRDNVKTVVYLTIFGGGANRAAVAFSIPLSQGKEVVEEFHANYPEIRKVSKQAQEFAKKNGYVAYWTGQRRHFWRGAGAHKAFNAVIQGGEAEIVKRAMIRIAKEVCDENCFILLQIHDEVVLEIREGMAEKYIAMTKKIMEEVPQAFCEYVGVNIKFKASAKPWGAK